MHGVELLGLMLGDFQHLHGKNAKAIFLELFDDVSDRVLADGVRLDDGEGALQSFHRFGRGPWSSDIGSWVVGVRINRSTPTHTGRRLRRVLPTPPPASRRSQPET